MTTGYFNKLYTPCHFATPAHFTQPNSTRRVHCRHGDRRSSTTGANPNAGDRYLKIIMSKGFDYLQNIIVDCYEQGKTKTMRSNIGKCPLEDSH